jgi:hypothetical protein
MADFRLPMVDPEILEDWPLEIGSGLVHDPTDSLEAGLGQEDGDVG